MVKTGHNYLIGGWTNPFEFFFVKMGSSSPNRGENKKLFETTTQIKSRSCQKLQLPRRTSNSSGGGHGLKKSPDLMQKSTPVLQKNGEPKWKTFVL